MLSENAINKLSSLAHHIETRLDSIIIDGDTHPSKLSILEGSILERYQNTPDYYQGRPIEYKTLIKSMDQAGVDMSLIWQNPASFNYVEDQDENFDKLLKANRDIYEIGMEFPDRFIACGWTDPKSLGVQNALKLAKICVEEFGFPIVKMNPAQNGYPIDSDEVFEVIAGIIELGATPAFHFGGDSIYTPAKGFDKLLSAFPDNKFIGVHMGGGGSHYVDGDPTYIEARALGLKHKNLFYVMSAKRDCHMESALIIYLEKGSPYSENLAWGSDAPYGLQSWNLGGIRGIFDALSQSFSQTIQIKNPKTYAGNNLNNFLGNNLGSLIIHSCKNVLKVGQVVM